jgi:hypothetical protein
MVDRQDAPGLPLAEPLDETDVQAFAAAVRGALVRPGDEGYDAARAVFNGMVDRRPALIVRCLSVADVARGVEFARSHGLPLSVRGGGHGVAGKAVCDGGLMLDLSPLKGIRVIARGGFHKETLASVAEMWDFTREEQPPWWVKKECGGTELERHDNARRLRNLARNTMRKLHAELPVTESARTSSPDPAEHKGKRLPLSLPKLHALSCAMFPDEGEDGLSRMAAARLSEDPGCPTAEQIAERARGLLGDPAPSLEDVAAAVELVLKGRRWEMEMAG